MKRKIQTLLKQIVCIIMSLIVIVPFYMVIINSFKTKSEAARMSLSLPKQWVFRNYLEVIEKGRLFQGFANSFLYAFVSTTIGVICCAMGAFVICRNRTKLNNFLYYFILCGLFFPSQLCNPGKGIEPDRAGKYETWNYRCIYKLNDSILYFYNS